ncbi:MAG: metallophosphoesterase family protein [Sedimenticola sp.]
MTLDLGDLDQGPLLLFGGPYSNLAATQAMRREAELLGIPPERVICNGDIVAYCAQPAETLEAIRTWGVHLVAGNCEVSLAEGSPDCGCGFEQGTTCALLSEGWYPYASARVDSGQRDWMKQLPGSIRFRFNGVRFQVAHGAPGAINRFVFPSTPRHEKQALLDDDTDVVIAGHSGIPFGEKLANGYWLNTGVIGMPANDGTPDGWYLLLQTVEGQVRVRWQRLVYDYRGAHRQMLTAGLDNGYARALLSGLWPSMDILPNTEQGRYGIPLVLDELAISPPGQVIDNE